MSQVTERTNIISINEKLLISPVHASMVDLSELISYKPLNFTMQEVNSFCPDNILSAINVTDGNLNFVSSSTSICSPNELRAVFGNSFAPSVKSMQAKGFSLLDAKKVSMLTTLSKMDFKVTDQKIITNSIKAVMNAKDDKILNTEIKTMMNRLETDHTKVFTANLAKACAAASVKVGFNQVVIKPVNGKLEVIAKNSEETHLLSEIVVNRKTNQVDCNTETIGISDGTCSHIIRQFNEELKKMGIRIGNEKTTFTGGVCQMSYSKMIDQEKKLQQRKKKEYERMKKMNSTQKLKN